MLSLLIVLLFSGCALVPVAVVGGGAVLGHAALGRKGPGAIISDMKLRSNILKNWDKEGLEPLNLLIYEGKVMLCGHCLDSSRYIALIEGATKIIDATYKGETFINDYAGDTLVQAKVKAKLLSNTKIQSRNYKILVKNGVLHILGTAYNQEEKDALIVCIGEMSGFHRFEYDIDIMPGPKNYLFDK